MDPTRDDMLVEAFESGRLDPSGFDHHAHVRLAWAMLERHPRWTAVERISRGLQALAAAHGHASRYHETLTVGYCLLIDQRRRPGEAWAGFAERNADLLTDGRALLTRHWSPGLLETTRARTTFVLPDRAATDG